MAGDARLRAYAEERSSCDAKTPSLRGMGAERRNITALEFLSIAAAFTSRPFTKEDPHGVIFRESSATACSFERALDRTSVRSLGLGIQMGN